MPRRISEHERLIAFAMQANDGQLNDFIDTIKAIRESRFPESKPTRKSRKKVAAQVSDDSQPILPGSEEAMRASSSN